jgi:multicomponent Na+:H+ antiporter subunit B
VTHVILQTATRFMLPLLLLFSVFLLFRGHNEPGGGFTGGLVGAAAFALYALAFDVAAARKALGFEPRSLIGVGLLIALATACLPLLAKWPLLAHRHYWRHISSAAYGDFYLGTTFFFDLGVYLVVLGVTLSIIWNLAEEE